MASPREMLDFATEMPFLSVRRPSIPFSSGASLSYLHSGKGKPVSLVAVRNGVTLAPMIAHPTIFESDWKLGFTPVPIPFKRDPLSLGQAAVKSEQFCADNSSLIVEVIGRIFTRSVAASQLSGPVGIARMAGMAAEMEWQPKFALASPSV